MIFNMIVVSLNPSNVLHCLLFLSEVESVSILVRDIFLAIQLEGDSIEQSDMANRLILRWLLLRQESLKKVLLRRFASVREPSNVQRSLLNGRALAPLYVISVPEAKHILVLLALRLIQLFAYFVRKVALKHECLLRLDQVLPLHCLQL